MLRSAVAFSVVAFASCGHVPPWEEASDEVWSDPPVLDPAAVGPNARLVARDRSGYAWAWRWPVDGEGKVYLHGRDLPTCRSGGVVYLEKSEPGGWWMTVAADERGMSVSLAPGLYTVHANAGFRGTSFEIDKRRGESLLVLVDFPVEWGSVHFYGEHAERAEAEYMHREANATAVAERCRRWRMVAPALEQVPSCVDHRGACSVQTRDETTVHD
jgi:hypothetical protein